MTQQNTTEASKLNDEIPSNPDPTKQITDYTAIKRWSTRFGLGFVFVAVVAIVYYASDFDVNFATTTGAQQGITNTTTTTTTTKPMQGEEEVVTGDMADNSLAMEGEAIKKVTSSRLAGRRPNIVIFIGDDQSIFDYATYGNNTAVPTSTTDLFAKEGLVFDKAFTGQAICAPSRSIMFTGLYPVRNGCFVNHRTIRPHVRTLPQYLRKLGYDMYLAGKSHVGPYFSFPWERWQFVEIPGKTKKSLPLDDIETFILNYDSDNDRPFCMIVASEYPHPPYPEDSPYGPDDVLLPPFLEDNAENRETYAGYYANIIEKEKEFARLLEIINNGPLASANSYSLKENTVVIYTDDHGALGGKYWTFDRGMNIAMMVRWPGVIKPGERTKELTSFTDFVPTLIELAGGVVPDDLDGKSMLPTWEAHSWEGGDDTATAATTLPKGHEYLYGVAHRQGILFSRGVYPQRSVHDGRYHYIYNFNTQERIDRENIVDYFYQRGAKLADYDEELLFDTETDPYELNNIGHDVTMQEIKAKLKEELFRWMVYDQNDFLEENAPIPFLLVEDRFRLDIEDPDHDYLLPEDKVGVLEGRMQQFRRRLVR